MSLEYNAAIDAPLVKNVMWKGKKPQRIITRLFGFPQYDAAF